jgi:hypothetical protein
MMRLIDYNSDQEGAFGFLEVTMYPDMEPGLSEYAFEAWEHTVQGGMSFSKPVRDGLIGYFLKNRIRFYLMGGTYVTGANRWLGVENTTTHGSYHG